MTLFDVYVMVDWSAASAPTKPLAPNTIWIAIKDGDQLDIKNVTTRMAAMALLSERFEAWLVEGKRVFAGFDFSFGYPAGAAKAITGEASWCSLWAFLGQAITDDEQNANNRFKVADQLNRTAFKGAPKFWGRPPSRDDLTALPAKKKVTYGAIAEQRIAETFFPRAQPVWKLFTTGSVGGQSMMGIKHLHALRQSAVLREHITVWPFETDFDRGVIDHPGVLMAELYPSSFPIQREEEEVLDRAQVRSVVEVLAARDKAGTLRSLLAAPPGTNEENQALMLAEEGSIVGAGQEI